MISWVVLFGNISHRLLINMSTPLLLVLNELQSRERELLLF